MLSSDLKSILPTSDELPCSDDMPVDNEDQNFVPNWLLFLLEYLWRERQDWYFAVDMAIYHTTGANPRIPVVPDGFLSLGVERRKGGGSRNSYVTWEENRIVPIMVLEVVSQTPGSEYDNKQEIYRNLGVLYYVVYNARYWRRDGHQPLEVYKLVQGQYQLQIGEPFCMPEVGLGIGRCPLPGDVFGREVLSWYDERGDRHLTEAEVAIQQARLATQQAETEQQQAQLANQRAEEERQRAERLAQRLRDLGEEV